ncbi:MAG: helix-turn-helix domain-containing protein [Candidatus Micrarchaeota archaeon]
MTTNLDALREILTENEAKVYLTLLEQGSLKAGKTAKEASLDRSSTYNALNSLIRKGFVSYVKIGTVKWFQPSNPEKLQSFLHRKISAIEEILPELKKKHSAAKLEENVRLYKGLEGVRTVLEDIVRSKELNRIFGSEGQVEESMPLFARKFISTLQKNKIPVKSIVREGRSLKSAKYRQVKSIPMRVKSPVVTNVYGNKIAIILWSNPPEAILIENKRAADTYKEFFDFMWTNSHSK